jgi:hypothetical protein
MALPIGIADIPQKGGSVMKIKKLFRKHLVIVLLCGMVIGFGLPRNAKAVVLCNYKGYVVQLIQFGSGAGVRFREKPIDAGMYLADVGIASMDLPWENTVYNSLRSAHQNNTKVGLIIQNPGVACPVPDLSLPGQTFLGDIIGMIPPSEIP